MGCCRQHPAELSFSQTQLQTPEIFFRLLNALPSRGKFVYRVKTGAHRSCATAQLALLMVPSRARPCPPIFQPALDRGLENYASVASQTTEDTAYAQQAHVAAQLHTFRYTAARTSDCAEDAFNQAVEKIAERVGCGPTKLHS